MMHGQQNVKPCLGVQIFVIGTFLEI